MKQRKSGWNANKNAKSYKKKFLLPDRDLQCDFDNPFWEENDCNWRYNQSLMTSLAYGSSGLRFQRQLVNTPDYNYWMKPDSKTGKCKCNNELEKNQKLNILNDDLLNRPQPMIRTLNLCFKYLTTPLKFESPFN